MRSETSVSRLLHASCQELAALLDAHRTVVSRVIGDLIVELSGHDPAVEPRRELFLLADYPLTQRLLEQNEPVVIVRSDPDADPAEVALLAQLGFGSVLMLPLSSRGKNWGLVEIYADESGFSDAQVERATSLVTGMGALLAELESAG
jgi:transcriptional regulator with GAF, ATPase, and Fis domain